MRPADGCIVGSMRTRPGFTLLELVLALAILGVLAGISWTASARARHQFAVRNARAELAAAVAVTRSTAILAGGATLVIDVPHARAWIETAGGLRDPHPYDLAARHGVSLHTPRGLPLALRYDALGIGRMANATVTVRRGTEQAAFVVSSYGRVRR
jgi:prepilin-type N-terminal cleavage/methylation domain-containing protein